MSLDIICDSWSQDNMANMMPKEDKNSQIKFLMTALGPQSH